MAKRFNRHAKNLVGCRFLAGTILTIKDVILIQVKRFQKPVEVSARRCPIDHRLGAGSIRIRLESKYDIVIRNPHDRNLDGGIIGFMPVELWQLFGTHSETSQGSVPIDDRIRRKQFDCLFYGHTMSCSMRVIST